MTATPTNPFAADPDRDPDRAAIWEMLVTRDIAAFLAADWAMVAEDFLATEFFGIDAGRHPDPAQWRLGFADLASYRDEWLRQAAAGQVTAYAEDRGAAIHRATRLEAIEIAGDRALARKCFMGRIALASGGAERMEWQTLYHCRNVGGVWKICGFIGYLPNPMR
ncbi:hypothetical protein [Tropicimonas sp. IMCC34043]|uniref:hypothetical protein n=1 Tax=Tropicimonas sp. IMCC34043 TaxID=2248760 RepID=UPI000E285BA1|nr:hypothetical protein [Tropicimonas sp. IMCC34043]